jgi:hypothetical protein
MTKITKHAEDKLIRFLHQIDLRFIKWYLKSRDRISNGMIESSIADLRDTLEGILEWNLHEESVNDAISTVRMYDYTVSEARYIVKTVKAGVRKR